MLKNVSKLEIVISEKTYQFICDCDCPLSDVKECLFQFQKYIGQIEDANKSRIEEEQKKTDSIIPDEVKE